VVVPTGTATPWVLVAVSGGNEYLWACPVEAIKTGSDLLAEALRMEGVVRSLGPALSAAEDAELSVGWFGWIDGEDDPTFCNKDGETPYGDEVDEARACVIARVVVHSWQT
jgi:hypothetical protein